MVYRIEYRIRTLAEHALSTTASPSPFCVDGLEFSNWESEGSFRPASEAWLVRAEFDVASFSEASKLFSDKLMRIVPRATFISQCYTQFQQEPFVVLRPDLNLGLVRLVIESSPVGLMFMEQEREALIALLENVEFPNQFFYYWQDAVNATGYSAKLLLMCSALDAITKKSNGERDHKKRAEILGEDLKNELFEQRKGLRNRLVHGEYFRDSDSKNYVLAVHKAVLHYFNKKVLKKDLLNLDIVRPHRHMFDNKEGYQQLMRPIGKAPLNLKAILADCEASKSFDRTNYEWVDDKNKQALFS